MLMVDGVRPRADYDEEACARFVPEPAKRPDRTPFERDRARVLHSAALRRLADKTQVVAPGESDFPRTRLTHSLECAQIGRELGASLGCDPDLVDAACLAHDLGHPPFGHNGESALDAVARPCGGFEGNAQSLRILTRLEAKRFSSAGRSVGLNLTRAALDAAMKYPWRSSGGAPKYGVYTDDTETFSWVRGDAPENRTCLEAQVMDWADDVAYSVHDLEDGLYAGHVDLARLRDRGERRDVCRVAADLYTDASVEELEEAFTRLLRLPYWPSSYDGTLPTLAGLKDMTSQLIGRLCRAADDGTRALHGRGPLHRYNADLVVPLAQRLECAILKGVAARYVMTRDGVSALRARQRELVAELAEALLAGAPASLDPAFRVAFDHAPDDVARLRVVVDNVASLTDTSAVAWHRRLTEW
ncbi:MAG: deoxyguanosinetriphosphate triphosphohydrolase [Streptosporangiaceae bacterium]